ncbi:MAG: hypothetical protein WDN76_02610 [Alphaproteobacteria bacterium]
MPLPEPFDYKAPSAWGLVEGSHVIAPLGPNLYHGVVWRIERNAPGAANLKSVDAVMESAPPLPEESRHFIEMVRKVRLHLAGQHAAHGVLRSPEGLAPSPVIMYLWPRRAVRREDDGRALTRARGRGRRRPIRRPILPAVRK